MHAHTHTHIYNINLISKYFNTNEDILIEYNRFNENAFHSVPVLPLTLTGYGSNHGTMV